MRKSARQAREEKNAISLSIALSSAFLGRMVGEKNLMELLIDYKKREYEIKKLLTWPEGLPVRRTYTSACSCCNHHEMIQAITQVALCAKREKGEKIGK